jgi:hypothetical protein
MTMNADMQHNIRVSLVFVRATSVYAVELQHTLRGLALTLYACAS